MPPVEIPPAAMRARERAGRPDATVAEGVHTATMLLSLGFVDMARELLAELIRLPPAGQNALMELCLRIKAGDSLRTDPDAGGAGSHSEILIAPNPRAHRVILIFASGPGRYQEMENPTLRQRGDAHLIFLRDRRKRYYLDGIEGVGDSYDASLTGLRKLFARLPGCEAAEPQIYCVGHSRSGFAALRFGLHLGARAVLCTSPYTTLSALDAPAGTEADELPATGIAPELLRGVAPLYRAADRRPRVTLCYGAENRRDAWMAEQMRDIPGVTLLPLAGVSEHNSLIELNRDNRIGQLIEAMLAD